MFTGFLVLFVLPIFLIGFVSHIIYDLYKDYVEQKKFEKKLKKKYPLAYENR